MRAAVLTPMPGIEVRTPARGVCIEYPLDLGGDLFSLLENGFEAVHESGQDRVCGRGAGDGDGLLAERGHDRLDQFVAHARRVDLGDHGESAAAGPGDAGRSAAAGQYFQHGRVADLGADGVLEGGVDASEQAADPVC